MGYVIAAYVIVVASLGAYGIALARERRRLEQVLALRKKPVDSREHGNV